MKNHTLITLFATLCLAAGARAQLPTNNIAPAEVNVVTDTNGVLVAPADFFTANEAAIAAVVAAGSQTPLAANVDGAGHALTNLAAVTSLIFTNKNQMIGSNATFFTITASNGFTGNLTGNASGTAASITGSLATSQLSGTVATNNLPANLASLAANNGLQLTNVFASNGIIVFPNFAAIATTKPNLIGQIGVQQNGGGDWAVYIAHSLTTGDWIGRPGFIQGVTIGDPLDMPENVDSSYPLVVYANGNLANQGAMRSGIDAQMNIQCVNMNGGANTGMFCAEVTNTDLGGGVESTILDANAIQYSWVGDNAPLSLFGGMGAIVMDPGRRLVIGGPINVGAETLNPNHALLEVDLKNQAVFFNALVSGNNVATQTGAIYGAFIANTNNPRGASFVSPSNYYAGGNYFLGTNGAIGLTDSKGLRGDAFDRAIELRLDNAQVTATNFHAIADATGTLGFTFNDQSGITSSGNGNLKLNVNNSGQTLVATILSTGFRFENNALKYLWGPGGGTDTGISRAAAGMVKIEDGSGNSRDLIERTNFAQAEYAGVIIVTNGGTFLAGATNNSTAGWIGNGAGLTNIPEASSITVPMGAWFTNNVADGVNLTAAGALSITNAGDAFAFAHGVTNVANCRFALPWDWDGGTVQLSVRTLCTGTNAASATNAVFGFRAAGIGDGDPVNSLTWGTLVAVTNHIHTNSFISREAITRAVTVGNSPTPGKSILWQLQRLGGDAGDTMTNTATAVTEVRVYYKRNTIVNFPTATP